MTPERWREVSRVYGAALQCAGDQRAAYLAAVCGGDAELRREVESLLSETHSASALNDDPLLGVAPLMAGRMIGAYEIQGTLGAGGMGHVYRARDAKLGRAVALKVLPALSTVDVDHLARFRREAQLLASLNHPNIAQIYGIEDTGGMYALVLELVEGPTLADRIAGGRLALPEVLRLARQIIAALEAAHHRGIVHRDLKPSNIKVRSDGTVKILDFGLAKALESDTSPRKGITAPAAIMGTLPYMAPEQARGKESDTRADIWSFGVVLYEMLTARSPFEADTLADTVAAVLSQEPDWSELPEPVRPLVRQCLQKDPVRRLQDIADARLWLEEDPVAAPPAARYARLATVAAVAGFAAAAGLAILHFGEARPAVYPVRLQIEPPAGSTFGDYFVTSPDGRHVAFQAFSTGRRSIWVHSLEWGESRLLPRASDVSSSSIFWSADSRFVGYVSTDLKLKKIDIIGGPAQHISDLPGNWGGATWNADDVIVFGQANGGLMRVAASGGVPSPLTRLEAWKGEIGHGGPRFLPDGRHFIYSRAAEGPNQTALYVGSIDTAPDAQTTAPLLVTSSRGVFAPSDDEGRGHLLLVHDNVLLAYPFDAARRRIDGDAIPIAENVDAVPNGPVFISAVSASQNGTLAYRPNDRPNGVPVWLDLNGREVGRLVDSTLDRPAFPRISPDGQRVAVIVAGNLWVYHTDGRPPIKLTFDGNVALPLWTPDGRHIVYEDNRTLGRLRSVPADRVAAPEWASPPGHYHPFDWSPDGKILAAGLSTADIDIVRFAPGERATVETVLRTEALDGSEGLALSPDGAWLAYSSTITGRSEIWVQPYPGPGTPVRLSSSGGRVPAWSRGGEELYYVSPEGLMAAGVKRGSTILFGSPTMLTDGKSVGLPWSLITYDIGDGRIIGIQPTGPQPGTSPINLVLNWTELVKRRE